MIKQGGASEAAISGVSETIDSISTAVFFLLLTVLLGREMVKESDILVHTVL